MKTVRRMIGIICLFQLLWSPLRAAETRYAPTKDVCGRVTCEGKGVEGVVVTDGTDCVQTDAQGAYRLEAKRGVRWVYLTLPAGYLAPCSDKTLPRFYQRVDADAPDRKYDFELMKNPLNDARHLFTVQADVQVTSKKEVRGYGKYLEDMTAFLSPYRGKQDIFGIDCGDIVGDSPQLFPAYIQTVGKLDIPIFRAIGNHDMTYGGRTFEYSFQTFENYFGPTYYSFNKGKAHYIVLNNNFYVNRDYQYIGYIDERTFAWMEQDLKFVPQGNLVFVIAHIPTSLTPKLKWNALIQDETSNASGLYELLKGYHAHIISGHTHFNLNVCFNDKLMEHNTAAVCGIWWKADICMDGTPVGYGIYEVDGTDVKWKYKSAGYSEDYQFRTYPTGSSDEYPTDIIANVWNWDPLWKVEWYEDDKRMGEMIRFNGYDPEAKAICADKKRVEYDWISPVKTEHLFRATPKNAEARIEIRVTDRFGKTYKQPVRTGKIIRGNDAAIRYVGRTQTQRDGSVTFDWVGTYLETSLIGSELSIKLSETGTSYYNVFVDDTLHRVVKACGTDTLIRFVSGVDNRTHRLRIQKRTEGEYGKTTFHRFQSASGGRLEKMSTMRTRHIEFIGNSLTCGYGTEGKDQYEPFKLETENCNLSYSTIIARYFDADYTLIAHSGRGAVRNYGDSVPVSAVTMKDKMLLTFDEGSAERWDFKAYRPQLAIINLGTNDFSPGPQPEKSEFIKAYTQILKQLRRSYGQIPILCIYCYTIPAPVYTFYEEAIAGMNDKNIHLLRLKDGLFNEATDYGSSWHPNYSGQRKLAMSIIPYISTIMGWELPPLCP